MTKEEYQDFIEVKKKILTEAPEEDLFYVNTSRSPAPGNKKGVSFKRWITNFKSVYFILLIYKAALDGR